MHDYIAGGTAPDPRMSFAQLCDEFTRMLVDLAEESPASVVVDDHSSSSAGTLAKVRIGEIPIENRSESAYETVGTTYDFKLYNQNGTALDTYSVIPRVTVAQPALVAPLNTRKRAVRKLTASPAPLPSATPSAGASGPPSQCSVSTYAP